MVRGFDDVFYAPHSRYTGVSTEDVENNSNLKVLAKGEEPGIYICMSEGGKQVFVTGHPEYDRYTLDKEYRRDLDAGINPKLPKHYYPDDDPTRKPVCLWRSGANLLYGNWLDYFVYQETPYVVEEVGKIKDIHLTEHAEML